MFDNNLFQKVFLACSFMLCFLLNNTLLACDTTPTLSVTNVIANSDGTFDLRFDDGEKRKRVSGSNMRRVNKAKMSKNQSSQSSARKKFRRGDKVKVKYMTLNTWKDATITRANTDWTYDVEYTNGERELRVHSSNIKENLSVREGTTSLGSVMELEPLVEGSDSEDDGW